MTSRQQTPSAPPLAGGIVCVNCGAPISFRDEPESDEDGGERSNHQDNEDHDEQGNDQVCERDRATCRYCGVVNEVALARLRAERAGERHEELSRRRRRRSSQWLIGGALAAALLLGGIAASNTHSALRGAHAEVQRARAQVDNVRERQAEVVRRTADAAAGPDRDAELSGAENRVRIERARYDEAASAYNALSTSSWASLCASLFGMPERAPLSNEAHW